ncbi:hypothetical protein D9M68_603050 [compost metagenome]
MSSHHIVREKQEPALYIHSFADFNEEYLGQLLEWSPTVFVAANAYEKLVSLGLKIDVLVGEEIPGPLQENTKHLDLTTHRLTDLIKYLIIEGYPAVNIISQEKHFDDLVDFLPQINIVLFTTTEKSYPIKSGFSVWKPAGTIFRIDIISYFETSNLKQIENGDFVVLEDGFVSFHFGSGYLFISELL